MAEERAISLSNLTDYDTRIKEHITEKNNVLMSEIFDDRENLDCGNWDDGDSNTYNMSGLDCGNWADAVAVNPSFDFDNYLTLKGFIVTMEVTDNVTTEIIKRSGNSATFATRITTITDTGYVVRVDCEAYAISVTTTYTNDDNGGYTAVIS